MDDPPIPEDRRITALQITCQEFLCRQRLLTGFKTSDFKVRISMQADFDPKPSLYRRLGVRDGASYRELNTAPHKVQRSSSFPALSMNAAAFWLSDTAAGFVLWRAYAFVQNRP